MSWAASPGPRLMAFITFLHEDGRMPVGVIQSHLATLYGLDLSRGAIEQVLHAVASKGEAAVEARSLGASFGYRKSVGEILIH